MSAGSEGKRVEKEESGMVQASRPATWMEVQEEEWQGREEGRWGLKLAWLSLNSRGRWTQPGAPPDTSRGEDLGRGVSAPNIQESREHQELGEGLARADSPQRGEEAARQPRSLWPPMPLPGG